MKIMTVLGTRPEIIRLSLVIRLLDRYAEHVLVHTGQNSDPRLSEVFFRELEVRAPDVQLSLANDHFGAQVGSLFAQMEPVFRQHRPDRLLILGDTTSGLATIVARRLGIPVYHMEAGNRCFDDRVPEEVNRRVIDHCSTVLLPYTHRSKENLRAEGIPANLALLDTGPGRDVTAELPGMNEFDHAIVYVPAGGKDAPAFTQRDMAIISQPVDFFGVNIYTGHKVRAGKGGKPELVPLPDGHALTAFRWAVTPEAMYWGTKFYWERYQRPIVVTENGMSNIDWVALDGHVHDPQRIDFMRRHLLALERAAAKGVDVRGYFHWSIMDNFEWADGFKERFGLIYVDYVSQKRVFKDSANWYKQVIATNGKHLRKEPFSR